jgi:aryl-alcohol dehydrogenase-like predicted oxidoreductase
MSEENFETNLEITRAVEAVAAERGATAGQVALAWLLSRREWIVPIPGTKRVRYVEENAGAAEVELTADDLATLDALPEAVGDRYPGGRVPNWVSPPPTAR